MSSTIGPNSRFHRVSEIKECENQSKFVNQRVNEIETFFGNLCAELVSYTRRTSKLRNNGDEIARILLDYSNKEKINRTTSDALRKVSEYFATVEDYRHTEIDRIVGKVINPLSAYGEEIKHIKTDLKVESAARKREITNMRKLERSKTIQSSREAEIQLHNAMIDATKSANNLERCVLDFEGRRLKGLKDYYRFYSIEMLWHAKALETYSLAYNGHSLLHEEADLYEFVVHYYVWKQLTVLNNNLHQSQVFHWWSFITNDFSSYP
uniref:SJCHGC07511 protein n=1 Tax=Schistosoma japonicum TaxID=6182 RepID=Q5DFF6_SCHJA|nr:SJCHGC07511 protein [Schistosoma japonicum]